jgi:chaperonin GroES
MTPFNQIQQGGMQQGQPQADPSQQPPDPSMQQGQPSMPPPMAAGPTAPQPQEPNVNDIITRAIMSSNLADGMDEDKLQEIGVCAVEGFDSDLESVGDWLEKNNEWLKLALLMREDKTYPWPGASNVKYPLLATAAMQFSARAYPTLVPADNMIVKSRVIGYDPDGSRADKAEHIAKHMSYQIMHKMPDWEEDMDRLLMICSIVGVCFKETYKDPDLGVVSEIVYPENLIINYWAKSVEKAFRKTRIRTYTKNEYTEKVNSEEWLDIGDIYATSPDGSARQAPDQMKTTALELIAGPSDEAAPSMFLLQHTFYDIDEDGYDEPVIIVVHYDTKKVVRILPRFAAEGVKRNNKGKIVKIHPIEYFTDYQFLPSPDGSIYGQGFGTLLGPINEAVNSLCNQLIDAGTINNLQSGFIGKGLRLQMKESRFVPGEWKAVNATGDDLKSSIFPLPSKEPSNVLFQLMNLLIQSGNQLASVAEIMVGKMPGQNTPATTTQETVDQAMKVFTAIYKRIYRAMLREFQKIFMFNRLSPEIVNEEASVLNIPITASDYQGAEDDIIPAADPSGASSTAQFQQLQYVIQNLGPMGVINMQEAAARSLKLIQIADPEKLVQQPPPPPPDPKIQTEQIKQQTMQQKAQQDGQLAQQKLQLAQELAELKKEVEQMKMMFKQKELEMKLQGQQQEHQMDMVQSTQEMHMNQQKAQMDHVVQAKQAQLDLTVAEQSAKQQLRQGEQAHQQKMKQTSQSEAAKPKKKNG